MTPISFPSRSTTGRRLTPWLVIARAASTRVASGLMVKSSVAMTSPTVSASASESRLVKRMPSSPVSMISPRSTSLRRKSLSVTSPTRLPSSSVTGIPLMRASTIIRAASRSVVSGRTRTISVVMRSSTRIENSLLNQVYL